MCRHNYNLHVYLIVVQGKMCAVHLPMDRITTPLKYILESQHQAACKRKNDHIITFKVYSYIAVFFQLYFSSIVSS